MKQRRAISDVEAIVRDLQREAHLQYGRGKYAEALRIAEEIYTMDAVRYVQAGFRGCDRRLQARTDNLLLLGAVSFQLRNFSESIFYNQQACI